MAEDLAGFDKFAFTHDGKIRPVYRGGSGPGILVMHELPGMVQETVVFAHRLRDAGFTVYLPLFFGDPGRPFSALATVGYSMRLCISHEFYLFKRNRTSPVVDWLRALCRYIHAESGGPGVGVIGMCLTGGFAIPLMVEPSVLAPVLSQPSLPSTIGSRGRDRIDCARDLGCSPADLGIVRERTKREGLTIQGYRFSEDPLSPPERFDRLQEEFGESFVPFVIDSSPGNANGYPASHHAVFSVHYSHAPGTPTREAFDRLLAFYQERLL